MAINKKGARSIVVDGVRYHWTIRPQPSKCQGIGQSNLTVAIELQAPKRGSVLVVDVGDLRPDNWLDTGGPSIGPAQVATYVRAARLAGWQPEVPGGAFHYKTAAA